MFIILLRFIEEVFSQRHPRLLFTLMFQCQLHYCAKVKGRIISDFSKESTPTSSVLKHNSITTKFIFTKRNVANALIVNQFEPRIPRI